MNPKFILPMLFVLTATTLVAADQTQIGAGNPVAEQIARKSALVQSAKEQLLDNAKGIKDSNLRNVTLDGIGNPSTCIAHRAGIDDAKKNTIIQNLLTAGLINPADAAAINGGVKAGVFPPVLNDGSACPHLPLSFEAAPGSAFHGHHSYPGGLPIHEANNDESFINFGNLYRGSYGTATPNGLPTFGVVQSEESGENGKSSGLLNQDLVLAAPMWHDWAKPMVFQWNTDGTEFTEMNFGGNGVNDAWGTPGDSRTGGHHIMSIAETMKRGLSPELVITQASAHSAPTSGNEYKVVNWLHAAAIMAQIDPVAKGYLTLDSSNRLRLPIVRQLGSVDLLAAGQTNLLTEYTLHNLSDSDFNQSGPAVTEVEVLLGDIASFFGYDPGNPTVYNTRFRNVVFANLSAERLLMIYANSGLPGVTAEVQRLRQRGII
jgi:hypothetical protein